MWGGCARGVRVPVLTTPNKTACEKCWTFSYETRASGVTSLPALLLLPGKIWNKEPFRYSQCFSLAFQTSPENSTRTPTDSWALSPRLLSSCGRWAVHVKAGTASTSGWDLLLEAHSSNLHFQCPSSIKSHCFWLFRQCQLSCIPLFSVNIFTFVTPNWLNTTQHFEENSTSTWIKCNTLTISYKHSKLTAMGAGEAGDMNLDQGLHRFIGKAFCRSSPGAHTAVDWVTSDTLQKS